MSIDKLKLWALIVIALMLVLGFFGFSFVLLLHPVEIQKEVLPLVSDNQQALIVLLSGVVGYFIGKHADASNGDTPARIPTVPADPAKHA